MASFQPQAVAGGTPRPDLVAAMKKATIVGSKAVLPAGMYSELR